MTPAGEPPVESDGPWQYVGLGCMMFGAGLFGGGMVGVLVAKVAGWARHCASSPETGAPCDWGLYWFIGAAAGAVLLPVVVLFLRRRGRKAAHKSD